VVKKERKKAASERIITTVSGELAAIKQPIKSNVLSPAGETTHVHHVLRDTL
jgi:hypothetical protein